MIYDGWASNANAINATVAIAMLEREWDMAHRRNEERHLASARRVVKQWNERYE